LKYLLDSTLLIDHLNGVDQASEFLEEHHEQSCISVITVNEVLTGSEPEEIEAHESILDQFPCQSIDLLTSKAAAALRRQYRWKLADAMQATLALRLGLKLVTRNTRDFDPKKYDFVTVPYSL
jgi:predicted nucleic acid-binding protein